MPTFTATLANWTNATSDANFQAWGKYISDRMTDVGLVKTADTGQVDWNTATNPGGVNNYPHYEIRMFGDALQATAPVVFKVEYGEAQIADTPSIRISFGSGSNGSGTLTGSPSTPKFSGSAAQDGSTTIVGSGSNNRFGFNTLVTNGHILTFERTKDALGNDTSEGVHLITRPATNSVLTPNSLLWIAGVGDAISGGVSSLAALFPNSSTFKYGTQTGVAPIFPESPIFKNPVLGMVGYYEQDITVNTIFQAYMYGTPHNYFACNDAHSIASTGWRGQGGGTEAPAILYE